MSKKIIKIIVLILLILIPAVTFADKTKTILIIVDELPLNRVEELSLEKYGLGLINLKTRPPYSEEGLYLSINTGRKLGLKEIEKRDKNLEYLGNVLKKEKVSYIGEGRESFIVVDKNREVNYRQDSITYDLEWLIQNTDMMLNKSDVLLLAYDFLNESNRIEILSEYLDNYKNNEIIVFPKKVAVEDKYVLNKYLVPIIYVNGDSIGLLTSLSTNREGFVALEDVSAHLKTTYGHNSKTNIGKSFQIIPKDKPIEEIKDTYIMTMNLLIIAYIFHGFTYLAQGFLGILILNKANMRKWLYMVYVSVSTAICISLILGIFEIHKSISLYLLTTILATYFATRLLVDKKFNLIKTLSTFTYGLIVLGTIFYPKMIYNSYIGFNNLVYGARYFGLNNGIMGVLLATSILCFFSHTKTIENAKLKNLLCLCICMLNMIVLSTNFGANTGGFITSIALFGLMIYILFLSGKYSFRKVLLFAVVGVIIFTINMIFDNSIGEKSHAIRFLYRLKANGIVELISMASFKAKELLTLTLMPPFSIVIVFQIIILSKLSKYFKEDMEIKREAIIIIITSLIGFILNDTGVITFIYMIQYLILTIISFRRITE